MPSPIIAALDPEHRDDAPLVAGAALARLTGAPLIALSSYLHDPITNAVSAGRVDEDLRADALRELERRAGDSGADLMVRGGPSPARVLHDTAVDLDACLVVVGSTRRGPVGRVTPGSTAERLLHGAPCPVAVTPAKLAAGWTPRHVGVGFVDVEDAHGAVRAAAAIARAGHADLIACTAVEPITRSQSAVIEPYRADGLVDIGDRERAPRARAGARPSAVRRGGDQRGRGRLARRCAHRALGPGRSPRLRLASLRTCPPCAARQRDPRRDPRRELSRDPRPARHAQRARPGARRRRRRRRADDRRRDTLGGPRIDDARPGDWIAVDAIGGGPSRRGQILAVLGGAGHRHFRVRWDEEHESLHFPAQGTRLIPEEQLEHPA